MSVVKVDFGKTDRDAARAFASLIGLVQRREADILNDPVKYINMAGAEISRLRAALHEASEAYIMREIAAYTPDTAPLKYERMETITVRKDEYDRLQKMRLIIEDAISPPTEATHPPASAHSLPKPD